MTTSLRLESHGPIAVITLDRPPANALDHTVLAEFGEALANLGDARALVVTGTLGFFSAGLDLTQVVSLSEPEAHAFAEVFDVAMIRLFALEIPVIAAINGHAIAGGAVIAAAADFRLMVDTGARIGLPEILVGVPFPTSALEIVRAAWSGPHLATLLYRGVTLTPHEALAKNLVDELVPAGAVLERAMVLAGELAAAPRVAFSEPKRALRADGLARIAAARKDGADRVWSLWRSSEVLDTMRAYRDRVLRKR